ncbi:hypothetical protein P4O66_011237, partial [Electrophorus voltai]
MPQVPLEDGTETANGPGRRHTKDWRQAIPAYKTKADRKQGETPQYAIRQKVWVSTKVGRAGTTGKLEVRCEGPYSITVRINEVTYRVGLTGSSRASRAFHVSALKPVKEGPSPSRSVPREASGDRGAYSMWALLDSHRRGKGIQYLMDWEGYSPKERCWVPASQILGPELIALFHRLHPLKPALSRRGRLRARGPGSLERFCHEQLAQDFTDIFNLSLAQAAVPTCWKTSTITPMPKPSSAASLKDFCPVALTPITMKCFEKLTKELIVENRKTKGCTYSPVHINGTEVERVSSFKFLGVHISEDLSWTLNTSHLVKKVYQHLYFLRRLRKDHLSPQILANFYRCTIESVLTNCVTVWYGGATVADRKALKK